MPEITKKVIPLDFLYLLSLGLLLCWGCEIPCLGIAPFVAKAIWREELKLKTIYSETAQGLNTPHWHVCFCCNIS